MSSKKQMTPEQRAKNIAIGTRICEKRVILGYTQEELSVKVGLSRGAAAQWEGGHALPKFQTLQRVAEVLGTTTEWLMAGDDQAELAKAHTSTERDALSLLRRIPTSDHGKAIAILEALAKKSPA